MIRHEQEVLIEPFFHITLNHKDLTEEMEKYIHKITYEEEEDKSKKLTVEIHDDDRKWENGIDIQGNKAINVRAGHKKDSRVIFRGKITHIEADYPEDGTPIMILHCLGKQSNNMRIRQSKTWKNKKVSEVIAEMHKQGDMTCEVEDTKTRFEVLPQSNETNAEFTERWRKKLGWNYFEKLDGTFYFGTKKREQTKINTLGYRTEGLEIISFRPFFTDIEVEEKEDKKQVDGKGKEVKSNNTKTKAKPKAKPTAPKPKAKAKPKPKTKGPVKAHTSSTRPGQASLPERLHY